ncbi:hypothetical protein DFP72DRAFT_817754 [Ephemerocybe angulata]|uniref:Uncharacterized protein n=1 Tax=Ephemerocybe angulata TaxID=980116 RepID=A0A8H6HQ20_9AGAR|nr:hypothetical protein DFP72DRAFT_817754 [Tulosesus angulatus]
MSLFRPDLWLPESVDYSSQLLARPIFLADYIAATLIATLFLGVQLVACSYIILRYHLSKQCFASKEAAHERIPTQAVSRAWCYLSVYLTVLYTAGVIVYCIAFGQRYFSVANLKVYDKTHEQAMEWFRQNPAHDGVKMICIPGPSAPGGQELCRLFKHTKNLLQYQGLEVAFSTLVETLIASVDDSCSLQIYRFYVIYRDSAARWKFPVIIFLSLLSIAGPIIGAIALGKLAALGTKSDPWWTANFPQNTFLAWHSPWLAVVMPVLVNLIVTVAIITRIDITKRQIKQLSGRILYDSGYSCLTVTLIESALPSALFGVLAAVLQRAGKGGVERVRFSPMMLWVAFTALSPQFIIIRVIQGRSWSKEYAMSACSMPDMPLVFANDTGVGTDPSTATENISARTSSANTSASSISILQLE